RRQAEKTYGATGGALLYPGVNGNLSASREKVSGQPFAPGALGPFNLYNASVGVSYALDLFGGNRRQLEALESQVDFQRYQLEGARLVLSANIVTSAIRE